MTALIVKDVRDASGVQLPLERFDHEWVMRVIAMMDERVGRNQDFPREYIARSFSAKITTIAADGSQRLSQARMGIVTYTGQRGFIVRHCGALCAHMPRFS